MSRTVNGEACFKNREKEMLRKMIARAADFSGVELLTYCVMKNHFHVLVRVTPAASVTDTELVRRFRVLYPNPTDYQPLAADDLERILQTGGEPADRVRAQFLTRMGDVSEFMKTLKQRFSIWFNKTHDRFGPLWSDRFKSVLVDDKGFALQTVAAYIDLNPVRAGLVADPKDYRFCGYGEAVAGRVEAAEAIAFIIQGEEGSAGNDEALRSYRELLFGKGSAPAAGKSAISAADAARVLEKQKGTLPPWALLHCRIRFITEGAVLGSAEFVQMYAAEWQQQRQRKRAARVRPVPGYDERLSFLNHGRRSRWSDA